MIGTRPAVISADFQDRTAVDAQSPSLVRPFAIPQRGVGVFPRGEMIVSRRPWLAYNQAEFWKLAGSWRGFRIVPTSGE